MATALETPCRTDRGEPTVTIRPCSTCHGELMIEYADGPYSTRACCYGCSGTGKRASCSTCGAEWRPYVAAGQTETCPECARACAVCGSMPLLLWSAMPKHGIICPICDELNAESLRICKPLLLAVAAIEER